jgi:putative ABC transport system ATP-binding protein
MDTPLIQFEQLTFAYPDSLPVIKDATFSVDKGSVVLIRGESGIGKSTLLRLLCRLEEPTSGLIKLDNMPISDIDPPLLRRKICYLQQTATLVQGTVRDNLLLAFSFKINSHLPRPSDKQLEVLLKEFFLDGVKLEKHAADLSVGQKQRLCLIRSILLKPSILLLDEPTSALDKKNADIVFKMIEKLNREYGVTVFMITHNGFETQMLGVKVLEIKNMEIGYI